MASNSRRASFLTMGGANSLGNFAQSHQRAAVYHESALVDRNDVSPCTSAGEAPFPDLESGSAPATPATRVSDASNPSSKHLSDFAFPAVPEAAHTDENSSLLGRKPRRSSVFSLVPNAGSSTAPQTVSNAVNTLMGIAMLSLSFGLRLSGWVFGCVFFLGAAYITATTAKILGTILRRHKYCNSYGDIAHLYGGARFNAVATATFTVDLAGASLTLILLFSDAVGILFPSSNSVLLKLGIVSVTFLLSFLPLSVVSLVSLVGIVCTIGIMAVVVVCGLATATGPGSLLHPQPTRLWPQSVPDLLLSLGIFMAPWGGHPVYPELYRDMRHPAKYGKCCNWSFVLTTALDSFIAVLGYLMYGDHVSDSLTKSILRNNSAPWVNAVVCMLVSLLPVSKLALVVRPLVYVLEDVFVKARLYANQDEGRDPRVPEPQRSLPVKVSARVVLMALLLAFSLAFTSFGRVVAFLGSAICCTICITFPLMFHLKLNANLLTPWSRACTKAGICLGVLAALLGTYGALASDYA